MPENTHLLVIYDNIDFSAPIVYTFDLLLSTYAINYEIMPLNRLKLENRKLDNICVISYGKEYTDIGAGNQIHIYASDFYSREYLKVNSLPIRPLNHYKGLPIIYKGGHSYDPFVIKSQARIETNIDIIASSFFMVSRYEETLNNITDQFGRFPATASLAYKEGFLDRPIVNEYIELLWDWLDGLNLGFKRKKLWGSKDFAVCLTHDMDDITRYRSVPPLIAIKRAIVSGDVKRGWWIWTDYLKTRAHLKSDPYHDAFDYIVNLERKYGFASSFYFRTDGERYSPDDPYLEEMIVRTQKNGFELGLHSGDNAYNNRDILALEKEKLETIAGGKISGGRQHYLKWKGPASWRDWEAVGLLYDATLGFTDHEGFRCGICYPFRPFDLFENSVMSLWEVPLTVMDGTLDSYRGLTPQKSIEIIVHLLDTVERYNGIFVFLWHNTYMCHLFTPGWNDCFDDFYHEISTRNATVSTISDVIGKW